MSRRWLIGVAVCALLAGCGDRSTSQRAAPKPQAPKPTPTPTPTPMGMLGAPSLAFGGGGNSAELRLVRAVNAICRKVGPIEPPSASTPLDARKAETAREIRGLERLGSELGGLVPPTPRYRRLLGEYVTRVEAQVLLDRRIGAAAAAGDAQSVAVGMSENAHNRAARNAIVREAGLSQCLRARAPT